MNGRYLVGLLAAIAVGWLGPVDVMGQTLTTEGSSWASSSTPWGDPDLQGIWTNSTTTPLERPDDLAGRELLTDEERAARVLPTGGLNTESPCDSVSTTGH
jgi:hypothetical protein